MTKITKDTTVQLHASATVDVKANHLRFAILYLVAGMCDGREPDVSWCCPERTWEPKLTSDLSAGPGNARPTMVHVTYNLYLRNWRVEVAYGLISTFGIPCPHSFASPRSSQAAGRNTAACHNGVRSPVGSATCAR